jgi:hypothetical protein
MRWEQKGSYIRDEYGSTLAPWEMLAVITVRHYPDDRNLTDGFCAENHAIKGPFNLARARIDGRHCVGHGDGTWDLILGEFS